LGDEKGRGAQLDTRGDRIHFREREQKGKKKKKKKKKGKASCGKEEREACGPSFFLSGQATAVRRARCFLFVVACFFVQLEEGRKEGR